MAINAGKNRVDLITRSLEALRGANQVIFHLYNSTSPAQRRYVFNAERADIVRIATHAVAFLKEKMAPLMAEGTKVRVVSADGGVLVVEAA